MAKYNELGQKWCKHCDTYKDTNLFYKQKDRPDGVSGWCKECQAINKKQWLKEKRKRKWELRESFKNVTSGLM